MKRALLAIVVVIIAGGAIALWYASDRGRFTTEPEFTGLERGVSGTDLTSDRDPAVTLRFDPAFRYLGGQKFVLYGVADAEQHFFVETGADGNLKSVYWVQFEAYLPAKPYTYDYDDSPLRLTLGTYEFHADTAVFRSDPDRKGRRGSDGAMVRRFLASKGYAYPTEVVYARLVHLTDATRRKELMIIFMDDLTARGLTASALEDGGVHAARWPEVERSHLDRIRETLTVLPPGAAR